jgi:hypothetical protein
MKTIKTAILPMMPSLRAALNPPILPIKKHSPIFIVNINIASSLVKFMNYSLHKSSIFHASSTTLDKQCQFFILTSARANSAKLSCLAFRLAVEKNCLEEIITFEIHCPLQIANL